MSGNPRDPSTHLHGGERRPSPQEIVDAFVASKAKNWPLLNEAAEIKMLIEQSGRQRARGLSAFAATGASYTISYETEAGLRFRMTLEARPAWDTDDE